MNPDKKTLLVVEDDPGLQQALRWAFDGFEVVTAEDRESAIAALRRYEPQVVTLDLGLPPDAGGATEGLATLERILELSPHTKVIVVTGNNDRENALKAVNLGAWMFCQKPVDAEMLGFLVDRAWRICELELENRGLLSSRDASPFSGFVATSPNVLDVCRNIEKVAPTDATVTLLGESGTGKEVLARALHRLSPRAGNKFIAINCAAIPAELLESELFGYEKGAFTGAVKSTAGSIEYADQGTLFLDEIGDMPSPLQAKMLRFLQDRVITRVGGRREIAVDTRIICATNRDLQAMITEDQFREDLYYRISEITIAIPPLRERASDALVLAHHFLDQYTRMYKKNGLKLAPVAEAAIQGYPWPGNVRELENRVKRAVIMSDGKQIMAADLEIPETEETDAQLSAEPMPFNLREVRERAESEALLRALNHVNGNISQAAELLGIARPTFYSLMNKYGLRA